MKYLKFSKDIHRTDYRGNIQFRFQCRDEEKWETNRFEPMDTSWANDFPECVALFKRVVWFSFFENIIGFNLEETSSKRSPKNKKRCIVMPCFFLFL